MRTSTPGRSNRVIAVVIVALALGSIARGDETLKEARQLALKGKSAEAAKAYEKLAAAQPVAAAIGLSRLHQADGKHDDARKVLNGTLEKHQGDAGLLAELASLEFSLGRHDEATKHATAALKANAKNARARWIAGELQRVAGKYDAALAEYRALVDDYNATESFTDADELHTIGLAAGQYARWRRLSEQFDFLVNELTPEILAIEPLYWPAHVAAGRLFLEKYNFAEAEKSFAKAAAINPRAAEIHAAQAALALRQYDLAAADTAIKHALTLNPRLVAAHQLRADWHFAQLQPAEALAVLEEARKTNPRDDDTLGRLAVAYGLVDNALAKSAGARLGTLIAEVEARNARPGDFYAAAGDALDLMRRYPAARTYYELARRHMPQRIDVAGKLGLIQMRLGDEATGAKLLRQSFDEDPFNVRVKNTLAVLDVLNGYAVLETEHFIIKYDRGRDAILAKCAADYLERTVFPDLTKNLAFTPPRKTLIEFFNRARNTDGHGWFSARMVGLPYVGTVAACAGEMVALQSPTDVTLAEPYHWARVLRHEYVHVLNLQQTDFNIPHWYTEALAVRHEGGEYPPTWLPHLKRRLAEERVFNLDSINLGFIRPKSPDDWQLAYCQAALYAEYMAQRFGAEGPARLLAAYGKNRTTPVAIRETFGVAVEEFEAGYTRFLAERVKGVDAGVDRKPEETLAAARGTLKGAIEKQDRDAVGRWAERVIEFDVHDGGAHRQLADWLVVRGERERAKQHYEFSLEIDPRDAAARKSLDSLGKMAK